MNNMYINRCIELQQLLEKLNNHYCCEHQFQNDVIINTKNILERLLIELQKEQA